MDGSNCVFVIDMTSGKVKGDESGFAVSKEVNC